MGTNVNAKRFCRDPRVTAQRLLWSSQMSENIEALKSLHTALIDSRNGYEEALEDADGKGLTSLFREMISIHTDSADALTQLLAGYGERSDDNGSFMSTVHRTVIRIRSLFGNLDSSILPGLIDGEERILSYYDEAISASSLGSSERTTLVTQRQTLDRKISDMKRQIEVAA